MHYDIIDQEMLKQNESQLYRSSRRHFNRLRNKPVDVQVGVKFENISWYRLQFSCLINTYCRIEVLIQLDHDQYCSVESCHLVLVYLIY